MLSRASSLSELWATFKDLPWWKKLLLFLPFIIIAAIGLVWAFSDDMKPANTAIDAYNEKVDQEVKEYKKDKKKRTDHRYHG
jgi:hypothetical protein